jgi:hypothetical protein
MHTSCSRAVATAVMQYKSSTNAVPAVLSTECMLDNGAHRSDTCSADPHSLHNLQTNTLGTCIQAVQQVLMPLLSSSEPAVSRTGVVTTSQADHVSTTHGMSGTRKITQPCICTSDDYLSEKVDAQESISHTSHNEP